MIRVLVGELADQESEGVLRPVRSDLAPVTAASREVSERAGAAMTERLESQGPLPVGSAVLTPAGGLGTRFLIHVVVMSADQPQSPQTIQLALKNGLRRAQDWGLESVALPPLGISAGAINAEEAAGVVVGVLAEHLSAGEAPRDLSIVVANEYEREVFDRLTRAAFGNSFTTGA